MVRRRYGRRYLTRWTHWGLKYDIKNRSKNSSLAYLISFWSLEYGYTLFIYGSVPKWISATPYVFYVQALSLERSNSPRVHRKTLAPYNQGPFPSVHIPLLMYVTKSPSLEEYYSVYKVMLKLF